LKKGGSRNFPTKEFLTSSSVAGAEGENAAPDGWLSRLRGTRMEGYAKGAGNATKISPRTASRLVGFSQETRRLTLRILREKKKVLSRDDWLGGRGREGGSLLGGEGEVHACEVKTSTETSVLPSHWQDFLTSISNWIEDTNAVSQAPARLSIRKVIPLPGSAARTGKGRKKRDNNNTA